MIKIIPITDYELSNLLNNYEQTLIALRPAPYYIDNVNNYSFFISRLLKIIQSTDESIYDEVIERISFNKDFENLLSIHGNNYEELPDSSNLKSKLISIVNKLRSENKKADLLFKLIKSYSDKNQQQIVICNSYDEDFIQNWINKNGVKNCHAIRYKKFTRMDEINPEIKVLGYSIDGYRDFEEYYIQSFTVNLLLYDYEIEIYKNSLNSYKNKLDIELLSNDRVFVSGISYEKPEEIRLNLTQTLQNIIDRSSSQKDFEFNSLKDDPDIDSNEIIEYTIIYQDHNENDELKSTDTVFSESNELVRVNQLAINQFIRVYNLDFGEMLIQTAIELQGEKFKEIDYYSNLWRDSLKNLYDTKYKQNLDLHQELKRYGLSVLSSTLYNNWLNGKTKFPMRRKDLKAIYELSKDNRLGLSMNLLLKAKRDYTAIMIALGRDLKEEIKMFLSENILGEILVKNNITADILRSAINEKMPLRKIRDIKRRIVRAEEFND